MGGSGRRCNLSFEKGSEICMMQLRDIGSAWESSAMVASVTHKRRIELPTSKAGVEVSLLWDASAHAEFLDKDEPFFEKFLHAFISYKEMEGFQLSPSPTPQCLTGGPAADVFVASARQQDRLHKKYKKGGTGIEELAKYFHLPINEAAKQLDICPTVLKKICRRHGLQRWPHRKLKSIDKLLQKLQSVKHSSPSDPEQVHALQLKIRALEQERMQIMNL